MNTYVTYRHYENAWHEHYGHLTQLILDNKLKKICEIGGGANPLLSIDFIKEHGLEYTVLDISAEELAKAPEGYNTICHDILKIDSAHLENSFDLVFSKMLAEHIPSGTQFHTNIYRLLKPQGFAFHFFPTLFAIPFTLNKLFPESLSSKIINAIFKHRNHQGNFGKFPAYYHMCFGPTKRQISKLNKMGYHIESYVGFFGHGYFKNIPYIKWLNEKITQFLLKHPIPQLTSYSYLILKKH